MERSEQTTSLPPVQYASERGAGGKFRKPSSRKPPSTPYARPQQNQTPRTRWLSKLVDPACRLISGGASRILPSLFSKSSESYLPAPNNQEIEQDHDKSDTEVEENAGGEDDGSLKNGEFRSTGVSGPSSIADKSKNGSDFGRCKPDKNGDQTDGDNLSEIKQLIKGKKFSCDEIVRMIEMIRSRAVDPPDVEQENKLPSMTLKGEAERPIAAHEIPRKTIEEKQEYVNKALWGTSAIQDEVGPSPIEIAKAYMGTTRTSGIHLGSESILSKDRRASLNGDEFASKPFIPPPSPKSSIGWPGAVLQDQRAYLTPQSERGRFGVHNFPRTPYSRSVFSKSKSKLAQSQGDSNRSPYNSFTPLQQSQTPIYEQSRRNTFDDGRGSVGPIRRTQHKVAESPSRRSVHLRSSLNGPSPLGNSNVLEGYFPAVNKNFEPGRTSSSSIFQTVERKSPSSEVGVSTVHPHSRQMARKILEHLDRTWPSPKDKSAELKLATSWRTTQSSDVTTAKPSEKDSSLHLGGIDSEKDTDQSDKKNSATGNEAGVNSFFKVPPQENAKEYKDAANETTSASDTKVDSIFTIKDGNGGPFQDFRKIWDSQIKSRHENDSETVPNAADGEVQGKPPSHSGSSKPALSSIFIDKPDKKWTFSSDNSTGFSFPVSASTGVFSEPPTPTIMPSPPTSTTIISNSSPQQKKEGAGVPSYSFGLKKSTPAIVFSFPSTSSTPPKDEDSNLKFKFGSDDTKRISFSAAGKDAVCY